MSGHLHLPHPHLAEAFLASVAEGAFERFFHRQELVAHTDQAVIEAWASWEPAWTWAAEHGGKEER